MNIIIIIIKNHRAVIAVTALVAVTAVTGISIIFAFSTVTNPTFRWRDQELG